MNPNVFDIVRLDVQAQFFSPVQIEKTRDVCRQIDLWLAKTLMFRSQERPFVASLSTDGPLSDESNHDYAQRLTRTLVSRLEHSVQHGVTHEAGVMVNFDPMERI